MNRDAIAKLHRVTEAVYLDEFEKLRPILEQEAAIRTQLHRLDRQAEDMRAQSAEMHDYRAFGADILWRGWQSQSRERLNMELARLQARKLTAMDSLRKAHGQREAIAKLSERLSRDARQKRDRAQFDALCLSAILRGAS